MTQTPSSGFRAAVIGAGPAGLSMARALRRVGIGYDQFERHSDVGGIWDLDNPGTPMYESAHFISSRKLSGFFDFPMPDTYPDYPSNRQILSYTRSFAETFGLREAIRFNTSVERVTRDGERWTLSLSDGSTATYDAVVCATGVTWQPRSPQHPGVFDGEVRHAGTYRDPAEFRGKRVLIVGLGNSGADIACDAAQNADAAFVSVRRGYHIIPKHLFGMPIDEFAERGLSLPIRVERFFFSRLLRLIQGDLTRLGLSRPDHKLFETHPLLNSQLVHHLQHGDVAIRGDVTSFSGPRVNFADGTSEEIDLVLYATGYDWGMPYAEHLFEWNEGRPDLYLTAFSRTQPNLFGLGYLETNSSAYTLFDHISHVVAQHLDDQRAAPARAEVFRHRIQQDRPDLGGGINFVATPRNQGYVDAAAFKRYLREVRRDLGWTELTPGMFDSVRKQPTNKDGRTRATGGAHV
ncbi:flavin-containing monooxygenase [Streptomyces sp. NPDC001927]